jgi:hypothetical protein
MSLRFSIIKSIKTQVGSLEEDVVYEWDEEAVAETLKERFSMALPAKKAPIFGESKWSRSEIEDALKKAWAETVGEFKKVTIRIL